MAYNNGAAQPAANGYYTGPYGMSGQMPAASASAPNAGLAGSGIGGSAASAPAAYGGYQSPYGTPAAQPGSAYRTADTRNAAAAPAAAAAAPGGYYGGASAAGANAWNNEQWGRSASQPAGYSESVQPRGYEAPPAHSNPSIPSASIPSTSTSTGGFRPGSTGRNTGALTPSLSSAPGAAPSSVYPASGGYPAASNPGSLYPETDGARSASSTGFAGGYSYPSTTQMR
jgi:hypothetical protein